MNAKVECEELNAKGECKEYLTLKQTLKLAAVVHHISYVSDTSIPQSAIKQWDFTHQGLARLGFFQVKSNLWGFCTRGLSWTRLGVAVHLG